jgi:hypothetical protein
MNIKLRPLLLVFRPSTAEAANIKIDFPLYSTYVEGKIAFLTYQSLSFLSCALYYSSFHTLFMQR